tara:strand:+ start:329 stop:511 length:183 start_codon:yes stop_codon:yes gene_type:complete
LLVSVVPEKVTVIEAQEAVPCDIRIVLSGTPKESIATLIVERTTGAKGTHRDRVKATAVV